MDGVAAPPTLHAMLPWLLLALLLFVLQTLLPPALRYRVLTRGALSRLRGALGPRDVQPAASVTAERAQRALANAHEAMWVFVPIALVHLDRAPTSAAIAGAAVFVVARVLYVPAYLVGVPGVRSAIWIASWVGLAAMIGPLLPGS